MYVQTNLILRGESKNMMCDNTDSLEAKPGPIFGLHRCKPEASSTHT